ncbi:hypothetical protein ACEQ8H_006544 [Pleosporales sp. CAS-2024a]
MAIKIPPTIYPEAKLRHHLEEALEDLPNNLPRYDKAHLLDDLTFLLRSPLFLYAMSRRLTPPATPRMQLPPTPQSVSSDTSSNTFDLAHLAMRIQQDDTNNWVAQLCYGDKVLLEGRQLKATQHAGCEQSFFWFCQEASFLAHEYRAREEACRAIRSKVGRATDKGARRALKLRIRLRDGPKGKAGVWRVPV